MCHVSPFIWQMRLNFFYFLGKLPTLLDLFLYSRYRLHAMQLKYTAVSILFCTCIRDRYFACKNFRKAFRRNGVSDGVQTCICLVPTAYSTTRGEKLIATDHLRVIKNGQCPVRWNTKKQTWNGQTTSPLRLGRKLKYYQSPISPPYVETSTYLPRGYLRRHKYHRWYSRALWLP